jgi:hypothetical protein
LFFAVDRNRKRLQLSRSLAKELFYEKRKRLLRMCFAYPSSIPETRNRKPGWRIDLAASITLLAGGKPKGKDPHWLLPP